MPKAKQKFTVGQEFGSWLPMSPVIITMLRVCTSEQFRRCTGVKLSPLTMEFTDHGAKWCVPNMRWEKFCHQCFEKVRKDSSVQRRYVSEFQKLTPAFLSFCKQFYNSDLHKKSNKELWEHYEKYTKLYFNLFIWGEMIAFGARFELDEYLKNYMQKSCKA